MRFEELMEYAREQGKAQESRNTLIDLLEQYGKLPAKLRKTIEEENNLEKLRDWIRLAAKSDSIEEFMSRI
ncbi:MAG: hypothetical protein NC086_08520 [Alistipes sp.]|nr:hypothetical protein [Alistipes sp.]